MNKLSKYFLNDPFLQLNKISGKESVQLSPSTIKKLEASCQFGEHLSSVFNEQLCASWVLLHTAQVPGYSFSSWLDGHSNQTHGVIIV